MLKNKNKKIQLLKRGENKLLQIATAFSRDHTTILHAYDKITKEIEKNEETKRMVAEIKQKLTTCG